MVDKKEMNEDFLNDSEENEEEGVIALEVYPPGTESENMVEKRYVAGQDDFLTIEPFVDDNGVEGFKITSSLLTDMDNLDVLNGFFQMFADFDWAGSFADDGNDDSDGNDDYKEEFDKNTITINLD